mgnify:CR=1 FL=1
MSATRTCPNCGAAVADDLIGGQCPRCVAKIVAGTKVRYFGNYELLEEVGRGGMGVVFRARQISLNRIVAVKMLLHGDFASEEFVKRFHAEAEAAASLQHPNIVTIHEVGIHEGQHYFSMDYVEGSSLAESVRDKPLSAERATRCVQRMAEAIHYAHERGILHRDLKPSNVVIDPTGQPRITDFGLAKRLAPDTRHPTQAPEADAAQAVPSNIRHPASRIEQLTLSGQVLGAPSYMPPEQAAGKRGQVGVPSDVYALGAVLYHPPDLTQAVFLTTSYPHAGSRAAARSETRPTYAPAWAAFAKLCLAGP